MLKTFVSFPGHSVSPLCFSRGQIKKWLKLMCSSTAKLNTTPLTNTQHVICSVPMIR